MTEIETECQTRESAYAIWEAEGRPEGRAVEHWLAAEANGRPPVQSRVRRTRSGAADGTAKRPVRKTSVRKKSTAGAGMPTAAP